MKKQKNTDKISRTCFVLIHDKCKANSVITMVIIVILSFGLNIKFRNLGTSKISVKFLRQVFQKIDYLKLSVKMKAIFYITCLVKLDLSAKFFY